MTRAAGITVQYGDRRVTLSVGQQRDEFQKNSVAMRDLLDQMRNDLLNSKGGEKHNG